MKPLPAHITGFYLAHEGPPLLPDTWSLLRRAGEALARSLQGRVVQAWQAGEHPDRPIANFHEVLIEACDLGGLTLVGNRLHPHVAAAKTVPIGYAAPWTDILELPALRVLWLLHADPAQAVVWGPEDFDAPMTPALGAELSQADRSNLPRKRSMCVGEVVFNQWD